MEDDGTLVQRLLAEVPGHVRSPALTEVYRHVLRRVGGVTSGLREPAYRLRHGQRVARLALQLARDPAVAQRLRHRRADTVLWLAGLLHDVTKQGVGADPPGSDHAAEARDYARRLLASRFDREVVTAVADAAYLHNKRQLPASAEARVLQDADLVDHFGATEVWLAAYAAAARGEPLEACLGYLRGPHNAAWRRYAVEHAYFPVSRRVLSERIAYAEGVIARLEQEAAGRLVTSGEG